VHTCRWLIFNDYQEEFRTSGFTSNRLFDAVASGARAITDDVVFGDDAERCAIAGPGHAVRGAG